MMIKCCCRLSQSNLLQEKETLSIGIRLIRKKNQSKKLKKYLSCTRTSHKPKAMLINLWIPFQSYRLKIQKQILMKKQSLTKSLYKVFRVLVQRKKLTTKKITARAGNSHYFNAEELITQKMIRRRLFLKMMRYHPFRFRISLKIRPLASHTFQPITALLLKKARRK